MDVKTAMVYEFTGATAEPKYFTTDERKAFKESYTLPANMWIWLGRYDGVLPAHSLQYERRQKMCNRGLFGLHSQPTFSPCRSSRSENRRATSLSIPRDHTNAPHAAIPTARRLDEVATTDDHR